MAAAFGSIGTKQTAGTTTVAIAYPTGVSAGHLAIAGRCAYTAANAALAAESGWTQQGTHEGGTGFAADSHTTEVGIDTLELVGTESGSVTFDNGASNGGVVGVMVRYSKDVAETWDLAYAEGTDDTHAADRSVTAGSTVTLEPGDIVVAVVAVDTDAALTITSPAITASGITFGTTTRRTSGAGSATGTDGNIEVFDAVVSSGTATAAPALAFTTATSQCGPVAFLRLRAVSSATNYNGTATATETTTVTSSGLVGALASATLTAAVAITAAGVVGTGTGASVGETVSITATGTMAATGSATATQTASIAATGVRGTSTGSQVSQSAAVTAAGTLGTSSAAARTQTITITAAGTIGGADPTASATLPIATALTSAGTVGKNTAGTAAETVSVTSAGQVGKVATATTTATFAITAAGVVGLSAAATVPIGADITATGTGPAQGDITATATLTRPRSAQLTPTTRTADTTRTRTAQLNTPAITADLHRPRKASLTDG